MTAFKIKVGKKTYKVEAMALTVLVVNDNMILVKYKNDWVKDGEFAITDPEIEQLSQALNGWIEQHSAYFLRLAGNRLRETFRGIFCQTLRGFSNPAVEGGDPNWLDLWEGVDHYREYLDAGGHFPGVPDAAKLLRGVRDNLFAGYYCIEELGAVIHRSNRRQAAA